MSLTAVRSLVFALLSTLFSQIVFAQSDDCASPTLITPVTSCSYTSGTLYPATSSANSPASCGNTAYDVWYYFDVPSNTTSVVISSVATGNSVSSSNTFIQVFSSGICSSTTSSIGSCTAIGTNITLSNLTVGARYYFRVFSTTNPNTNGSNTTKWGFNVCVSYVGPPSNDDCSGATALTIGTTNSSGTVWKATASSSISVGCSTGTPDDDVWYSFVASTANATISLSSLGADLTISGSRLQLFSGSCLGLVSIGCGTTSINATGLIYGATYYIRVYSAGSGSIGTTSSGSTFSITVTNTTTTLPEYYIASSQTNEVFQQLTLSPANTLYDPWEITYGSDGYLWITEARGYKIYRMDPSTGVKTTVLDISQNSTFLPSADQTFNVQFASTQNPWPQGGMAGLALHPDFMNATAPKKYVYVSYVHSYTGYVNGRSTDSLGAIFVNRIVRFTYNTTTSQLESPVSLCDTLPGSSDHNSQRMIIAPVNGTYYLFYAQGDMGAGQFANKYRLNKAQLTSSYEGKILRFNLEDDGDVANPLDKWIPNDNPYNGTTQSAVWCVGIRNNQGFAYAKINGTDLLYGSSHGPYSDDEINILEKSRNYGHPLVVGYSTDGNYDGSSVGAPPYYTTLPAGANLIPIINSEADNAATIGTSYKDPILSMYAESKATLHNIYLTNPSNSGWPSVAPSGMDIYTNAAIPGWKNSLLVGYLKGGRVMRLKLNSDGLGINNTDTVGYFWSTNRFRDVALSPDGKSVFAIIDKSSTTSGPTSTTPMVSACPGCVLKYTFLGYQNSNSRSTIPTTIPVTTGTSNSCNTATTVTIDASNNNIWVPITGPDGNIMAEIKANGNNLGTVTASFYSNSGTIRKDASSKPYLDRNMTITPQVQPSSAVDIRLYLTNTELNALISTSGSGIASVSNLHIFKNSDACGSTIRSTPLDITPTIAESFGTTGDVLEASITSFSSFYFAGSGGLTTLPVHLISFTGALQNTDALLQWETANEQNTSRFILERSTDGTRFQTAGTVAATGGGKYAYTDKGAALLPVDLLYYRLKTIDKNGTFTYSNVVALRLQHNFDVMVFPNPVKSLLTIRINNNNSKEVTVQVSDVQGRVIYINKQALHPNINNITVDVRHWNPQLYVVKVTNEKGDVLTTQKFEKVD